MQILNQAKKLQPTLAKYRQYLHENAEVGFALSKTATFVEKNLQEMGYTPIRIAKNCLLATIGKPSAKGAFLLRADMDALPIKEKSGEAFACKTGNMHACGHDMHTAMLLGAAKLLKDNERELKGQVKLLFQPAEEILQGAKTAVDAGVLENVQGAVMIHVMVNTPLKSGTLVVSSGGVTAPAADYFTVEITGKSCHGSAPWNGVDALNASAHFLVALQALSAREISLSTPATLTVGTLQAGTAGNAIADRAVMQGTLRAFDESVREQIKKRIKEIAQSIAKAFKAKAKVSFGGGCPTLVNDSKLSAFVEKNARELLGEKGVYTSAQLAGGETARRNGGSEDFAYISHKTPSVMLALSAGAIEEGYAYPLHHPKVRFNENVLCIGSAVLAHTALRWF
jgi:hippurate hydrolase